MSPRLVGLPFSRAGGGGGGGGLRGAGAATVSTGAAPPSSPRSSETREIMASSIIGARATYPSKSALSQRVLITRGVPLENRCTDRTASGVNGMREAPASRRRCLMYASVLSCARWSRRYLMANRCASGGGARGGEVLLPRPQKKQNKKHL